jgi:large subunit ribosomal protein L18
MSLTKTERRQRIRFRIRKTISGTATNPRLSVFRSNKAISCQLVDDINGVTLASASSKEVKSGGNKTEISKQVGELIATRAKAIGLESAKFDRGGNLYHGRVKSLADGAREAGLNF